MEKSRIAGLLQPFVASPLEESLLNNISMYVDILIRWNHKMNLTAVRDPEQMVTRHFGESLFAACCLFPERGSQNLHVIDIGSGAGFPGIPLKLWRPSIRLTLIESNLRKATFLREVGRALSLENLTVFSGRAEQFEGDRGDVVTLRAVEKFDAILPVARNLVKTTGRLGLLIGEEQVQVATTIASDFAWAEGVAIPQSQRRICLIGARSVNPKLTRKN